MTRLPTVGGDTSGWGTVLNQFLQVGHNATGTLIGVPNVYNVKDDIYGAKGDGSTNDTAAIQAAITACQNAGGGVVFFPLGIYSIAAPLTITNKNVILQGVGVASAILMAGSFSGAAALIATGADTGQIKDLYFKGNSATYSSNPAADAIQLAHSNAWDIQNVSFHYINGWCIKLANDATGICSFPILTNIRTYSDCKQGIYILGDYTHSNYDSGASLSECVLSADVCGLRLEDIHDVTVANLEGGTNTTDSTIHIVGYCAAIYASNFDLGALNGGAVTATPTMLIEANGNGTPTQIGFSNGILEDGIYALQITGATDATFANIDFVRGGTYGVNVSGSATDRITFDSCSFTTNGYTAGSNHYDINCTQSGHVKVVNCTFSTPQGTSSGQVAKAGNFTTGTSEVLNSSFLGTGISGNFFNGFPTTVRGCAGINPFGNFSNGAVGTSPFTAPLSCFDSTVHITGGTVSAIAVGGTSTGLTSGTFRVPAQQSITVTHTGAPSWTWFAD